MKTMVVNEEGMLMVLSGCSNAFFHHLSNCKFKSSLSPSVGKSVTGSTLNIMCPCLMLVQQLPGNKMNELITLYLNIII